MKSISLLKLKFVNFKGIRDLVIEFEHVTNMFGDNATYKTTTFDGFLWLLFGKDSRDKKDFEIKTLDHKGAVIPKIDHEIEGVLSINGETVKLRRIYKENWVKPKSKPEKEMQGHNTEYYINDVPKSAGEYANYIASIVDENVFKLITNVGYFNSIEWKQRRSVLETIAGRITDTEIAGEDPAYMTLLEEIKGKSFADFRAQISAQKKKLKDDLAQVGPRILEANRAMPDASQFPVYEKELAGKQAEMIALEKGLVDSTEATKQLHKVANEKQQAIHELQAEVQNITHNIRTGINQQSQDRQNNIAAKKRQLQTLQDDANSKAGSITRLKDNIESMNKERLQLREEWEKVNKEVIPDFAPFEFDETSCTCPTCKQALPADQVQNRRATLQKNYDDSKLAEETKFNTSKTTRLNNIQARGKKLSTEIADAEQKLANLGDTAADEEKIAALQQEVTVLETEHANLSGNETEQINLAIANDPNLINLRARVANLQAELDAIDKPDNSTSNELLEKKRSLQKEIDDLKQKLGGKQLLDQQTKRIAELERLEREYAQQIADLEGKEFTMDQFEKAKMTELEERVNRMFTHVRFKLFDQQINGGEVPACIPLINTNGSWVPFDNGNNAGRINAGLDIIRVLSNFHQVQAPIFIDNAEGVTRLLPMDAQVVRLVVSEVDKVLRIETEEMAVA